MTDKSQLSAETFERLQAAAARRGKTPDALVAEFLRQSDYVADVDAKLTDAIAADDRGELTYADNDVVLAWLDTWSTGQVGPPPTCK